LVELVAGTEEDLDVEPGIGPVDRCWIGDHTARYSYDCPVATFEI